MSQSVPIPSDPPAGAGEQSLTDPPAQAGDFNPLPFLRRCSAAFSAAGLAAALVTGPEDAATTWGIPADWLAAAYWDTSAPWLAWRLAGKEGRAHGGLLQVLPAPSRGPGAPALAQVRIGSMAFPVAMERLLCHPPNGSGDTARTTAAPSGGSPRTGHPRG